MSALFFLPFERTSYSVISKQLEFQQVKYNYRYFSTQHNGMHGKTVTIRFT